MDWIKRNYDQFSLAVLAFILLGVAGFLIYTANGFGTVFDSVRLPAVPNNSIPQVAMDNVKAAEASTKSPAKWTLETDKRSPFVSEPYIVSDSGDLVNPRTSDTPLHPPVPNKWIFAHNLDILDNNVLNEDPDGDGFTNLDEYLAVKKDGSDSTDPWDKTSHPPYWTKLRLAQYIRQPFRLLFESWDGDPKKPESMSFQINAKDTNVPSQFIHIGDMIEGTKFKVIKFEEKHAKNPATDAIDDVSELTIQHTERGDNVVLILNKEANSPDSYADFRYLWNNTEIKVQKSREFALLPDANLRYKVIDITDTDALIQLPTGEKVTVPHL